MNNIKQISLIEAAKIYYQLLPNAIQLDPITHILVPYFLVQSAQLNAWQHHIITIDNTTQNRPETSLLNEFLNKAGSHMKGNCIIVTDESYDAGNAFIFSLTEFKNFVSESKDMIFDGDIIILAPAIPAIIAFQYEWPNAYIILASKKK